MFFSEIWRLPTSKRFTRVRPIAHLDAKALERNAYRQCWAIQTPEARLFTEWEKNFRGNCSVRGVSEASYFCQQSWNLWIC